MKKIFLIVLAVIAVGMICFLAAVAMQPNEMNISRSATIPAPPAIVFDQVNDMKKSQEWSPWRELDPNAKYTYEGPAAGEGAKVSWDGNDEVGAGSMEIVESKPNERVKLALAFTRPMQDTSDVVYTFKPADDGKSTEVTWAMIGEHTFMSKAMCMFMDMDAMIGEKFEEGFKNLKATAEKAESKAEAEATTPAPETPTEEAAAS